MSWLPPVCCPWCAWADACCSRGADWKRWPKLQSPASQRSSIAPQKPGIAAGASPERATAARRHTLTSILKQAFESDQGSSTMSDEATERAASARGKHRPRRADHEGTRPKYYPKLRVWRVFIQIDGTRRWISDKTQQGVLTKLDELRRQYRTY